MITAQEKGTQLCVAVGAIMKNWLKALVCLFRGHNIEVGPACPVTGVKKLTCKHCGRDNMPNHSSSTFN
jgi:hypothetical protein